MTIQSYARRLNILTNRSTAIGVYLVLIHKYSVRSSLISVNMKYVTTYEISLDISMLIKKRKIKKEDKHLILIRL